MKKRCSRGKSCGGACIGNSKACRLEFPSVVRNALDKASHEVGVVELYKAVAAGGKRGGAAQFEKIRRELRQELGRNIRAGADAKELKKRLVEAGLIPKGKPSEKPFKVEDLFVKKPAEPVKREVIDPEKIVAKGKQKPDELYGAWDTAALVKFRKRFDEGNTKDREQFKDMMNRIDQELDRRRADPSEKPLLIQAPRQLEKSPGNKTLTPFEPKRTAASEDVMDDISRMMRGESPKYISMVGDESARVKIKSQIGQLQSALGLGTQTRKEVGRDLEGLLDEAWNLRNNLKSQQKGFKGTPAEHLALLDRLKKVEAAIQGPATNASSKTRYAREDAREHDERIVNNGISKQFGNERYRWEDSYGSGSKVLGRGAYGTVIKEATGKNAVKRGELGTSEAALIEKLGKADLGPKLISAQEDGAGYHPNTKLGRLAMTVVPGKPIGQKEPDAEIGGVKVADAYWKARAALHRMGVAHNDMHIDNVLIDDKGKGRFVDMGLAQDSPKAALAEAMGVWPKPKGAVATRVREAAGQGDWQTRRWNGTGGELLEQIERDVARGRDDLTRKSRLELEERAPVLARVRDNFPAVMFQMKRDGFTNDDIASIMDHGIRSPLHTYEQGTFGKMTNDQARKYIDILYEGVE